MAAIDFNRNKNEGCPVSLFRIAGGFPALESSFRRRAAAGLIAVGKYALYSRLEWGAVVCFV